MSVRISRILLLCILFLPALYSCNKNPSTTDQNPSHENAQLMGAPFSNTPLDRLYAQLAPETKTFAFDASQNQTFKLSERHELLIPAQSFTDSKGNIVESVQLEVIEANFFHQYLGMGLSTTTAKEILNASGMFFFRAQEQGEDLQLKPGAKLILESLRWQGNEQTYHGTRKEGMVEWELGEEMTGEMIPLPAEDLFPSPFPMTFEAWSKEQIDYAPYEGTWILTTEFRDRLDLIIDLIGSGIFDTDPGQDPFREGFMDFDIVKIYFENTDLPLYEVDRMAVAYLDSLHKVDAGKDHEDNIQFWHEMFHNYALQKNTQVIRFDSLEVDWNTPAAVPQLTEQYGFDESTAQRYSILYPRISVRQEGLKKERRYFEEHDRNSAQQYVPTTSVIGSLGWIHLGRWSNPSDAQIMDPKIRIIDEESFDAVELLLVYPPKSIIRSYNGDDGLRHFTKSQMGMDKLPAYRRGHLIAMGIKGDQSYLGLGYLKGEPKGSLEITLQAKPKEEILNDLAAQFGEG